MKILFEDADILVCEKEPGVPSQSDKSMDQDMISKIKNYLFQNRPGTVPYVGLIHRLDRPVGGIMVFGLNERATRALNSQVQNRQIRKTYLAVVTENLEQKIGHAPERLEDYLEKDGRTNLSKISSKANRNAKKVILDYEVLGTCKKEEEELSLVKVALYTGRHHQIRVQLANAMIGIWGDTKYNRMYQNKKGWYQIALYAYALEFVHPVTKEKMQFQLHPEAIPFSYFEDLK